LTRWEWDGTERARATGGNDHRLPSLPAQPEPDTGSQESL
jgi:hypothetical protein